MHLPCEQVWTHVAWQPDKEPENERPIERKYHHQLHQAPNVECLAMSLPSQLRVKFDTTNQKGNQDCTKLSEQRLLPETSPALYVEEENHAPKLNQISRNRQKHENCCNNTNECASDQDLIDTFITIFIPNHEILQGL
ncbi:unnamed protein product [Clavelina lepadiformis]|uniref:Uncharacterized protein n=1 Tax=Clavelina lepadiformis TaxID=159417 RepID=A0ABP0FSV0_CLALP